ncbi:MAG: uracil-DNA glycosylase [Desulfobacterales bacterium]
MPISCHKCIHYYVTWDQNFPHGCRGMGFKGRRYPMVAVRQIMNGKDCLLFVAKRTAKKRSVKQNCCQGRF